jgi:hypothetical protein
MELKFNNLLNYNPWHNLKKIWHQQCEGKMTTIVAITLLESLTKHHAFTIITNSSDKLP